MHYLGLDIGEKRIGMAWGDDETKLALELASIANDAKTLENIRYILEDRDVDKIIVGLPVSLSGKEEQQARFVRDFCRKLEKFDLQIEFQDERLSTVEAEKKLREIGASETEINERIDQAAAAVILQDYLNRLQE